MHNNQEDNKSVAEFMAILWNIRLLRNRMIFNNGKQSGAMVVLKNVSNSVKRWMEGESQRDSNKDIKSTKEKKDYDIPKNLHIAWAKNWLENGEDITFQVDGAWKEVQDGEVKIAQAAIGWVISNEEGDIEYGSSKIHASSLLQAGGMLY